MHASLATEAAACSGCYWPECRTIDDWAVAVAAAHGHKTRLVAMRPQRHPSQTIDDRIYRTGRAGIQHTWANGLGPTRLQTTPRSLPKFVWMVQTANHACLAETFSATTSRRVSQRSVPSCGCTRKEVRRLHGAEGCRDEAPASSRHRLGGAAFANIGTR